MNQLGRPARILIVNQHGENRGDEAAMRAMLETFEELLGDVEFTLLYQFQDRSLRLRFDQRVRDLPIIMPPHEAVRIFAYASLARTGVEPPNLLGRLGRQIIDAYRSADLVVSAPGGPYFGDLYANHEIVHWFFVWLAKIYRKPLFLYATSTGPFENRLLNPLRKRLYPSFDVLCVREALSAEYIRRLLGSEYPVHVTADSALQSSLEPFDRRTYFSECPERAHKFLVAVSLNNYKYPHAGDVAACSARYDTVMLRLLEHVADRRDCHFLFLPQLYGKAHSDVPYLETIASRLPTSLSWEIVDPRYDSDMQRRLFAMCDLHVASRYHPAIFGNSAYVPGICIYYEHKALGFMQQLDLERYAFDIWKPDADALCRAVDELLERRDELVQFLQARVPALRRRARHTTELAVELLQQRLSRDQT